MLDGLGASASTLSFEQRQLTAEGTIIGTFQYMAPEQLEGQTADARTDIFAFGTLLYEMATGRKAFDGNSQASLIASILTGQPHRFRRRTPRDRGAAGRSRSTMSSNAASRRIPTQRWQTARDVKLELEWIARGPQLNAGRRSVRARFQRREALAWTAAAVALAAAAALVRAPSDAQLPRTADPFRRAGAAGHHDWHRREPHANRHFTRWPTPGNGGIPTTDRRRSGSARSIPSRRTGAGNRGRPSAVLVAGQPVHRLLFAGDGELKKVDVTGGPARTICAAQMEGAPVWGRDGTILFTQLREGIFRVPLMAARRPRVTQVDRRKGELSHLLAGVPARRSSLSLHGHAGERRRPCTRRLTCMPRRSIPPRSRLLTQMDVARHVRPARSPVVRSGWRAAGAGVRYGDVPTDR